MKIYFKTNLDWYTSATWPVIDVIPPIGSKIYITPHSLPLFKSNDLPLYLEVKDIHVKMDCVEIDLWYSDYIVKLASEERYRHLLKQ